MKQYHRIIIGFISGLMIGTIASTAVFNHTLSDNKPLEHKKISRPEAAAIRAEIEAIHRLRDRKEAEELEQVKQLEALIAYANPATAAAAKKELEKMLTYDWGTPSDTDPAISVEAKKIVEDITSTSDTNKPLSQK